MGLKAVANPLAQTGANPTFATLTIDGGSAITSSGPGGALTSAAFTSLGTNVATALGNAANAASGFTTTSFGTWTPSFTNLTVVNGSGGATYSGTYTQIGRFVFWTAQIDVTGTCTTASTANSTFISNISALPTPAIVTTFTASDGEIDNLGVGVLTTTRGYTPTWAAFNGQIFITGHYSV